MKYIIDYWVQILFAISMITLLAKEIKAQRNGIKAILHDRIVQKCEYHIDKNEITSDDLDELEYLNEPYKALGGNGTVEVMLRKVHKLPMNKVTEEGGNNL